MRICWLLVMMLLWPLIGAAQEAAVTDSMPETAPPAPASNFRAFDTPNDNGHSITLEWELSADDGQGENNVLSYKIMRAESPEGPWTDTVVALSGSTTATDSGVKEKNSDDYFPRNKDLYYKIAAVSADTLTVSAVIGPVRAQGQWFNQHKWPVLVFVVLFTAFTLAFIQRAKRGAELYIRPLAGIDAVDEAIGRATEMGKPILYILGLGTAADIATIASFTILGRVAKKVAEYQTSLIVPCYDPIVMTIAQETVKTAYYDAGHPDAFDQNSVFFVTQFQFAYVGAVNGIMLREKPATNFYLGKFYAESLLMAETGSLAGAIQISGTDEVTQIPFFVVACDYTLIGEELYAASAYLGREPILLGTLKAQDYGKAMVIIAGILGILFTLFGWGGFASWFHIAG